MRVSWRGKDNLQLVEIYLEKGIQNCIAGPEI